MSIVFFSYNTKDLASTEKINISTRLFLDSFDNHEKTKKIRNHGELAAFKKYKNIQMLVPKNKDNKLRIFDDSRYLICVCGRIHNENILLKKYLPTIICE